MNLPVNTGATGPANPMFMNQPQYQQQMQQLAMQVKGQEEGIKKVKKFLKSYEDLQMTQAPAAPMQAAPQMQPPGGVGNMMNNGAGMIPSDREAVQTARAAQAMPQEPAPMSFSQFLGQGAGAGAVAGAGAAMIGGMKGGEGYSGESLEYLMRSAKERYETRLEIEGPEAQSTVEAKAFYDKYKKIDTENNPKVGGPGDPGLAERGEEIGPEDSESYKRRDQSRRGAAKSKASLKVYEKMDEVRKAIAETTKEMESAMTTEYGPRTHHWDGKTWVINEEYKVHNENSKGIIDKIRLLEKKLSGLKETLIKIGKSVPNKAMAAANIGQVGMIAAAEGMTEDGQPVMRGESSEFEGMNVTNESLQGIAKEGAKRQAEYDKEYYSPSNQNYQKLMREFGKLNPEQQQEFVKNFIKDMK